MDQWYCWVSKVLTGAENVSLESLLYFNKQTINTSALKRTPYNLWGLKGLKGESADQRFLKTPGLNFLSAKIVSANIFGAKKGSLVRYVCVDLGVDLQYLVVLLLTH